ncbi:hypothetical protein D7V86_07705 [bacterium D16-51]|nr:hypothetical protein D7V96_09560 [bacterium D16-59]RKI60719.1 hypothetical protein D7V86_07705 [bacterium D16-51]
MAITGVSNYNSVYESTYASSRREVAKKEETKEIAATQKSTETAKSSGNEEYLKKLQKQVPYIKLQTGYGLNTSNDSKVNVISVNPKLLEKMQNDPQAAKKYTQRLKDVESATKWVDNFEKSMGYTAICRHGYIDENGNFSNFAVVVRKDELNEKLRKEAQENAEERIEKSRENARESAEQLVEKMAEKAEKNEKKQENAAEEKVLKEDETATPDKAGQLLEEKIADSKDGTIYLDDTDMRTIIKAAQEDDAGKTTVKNQAQIGAKLDLKI